MRTTIDTMELAKKVTWTTLPANPEIKIDFRHPVRLPVHSEEDSVDAFTFAVSVSTGQQFRCIVKLGRRGGPTPSALASAAQCATHQTELELALQNSVHSPARPGCGACSLRRMRPSARNSCGILRQAITH